ncbi:MAG TPA: flagellar basal body protein [Terriglobia bacterium]
MILINSLTKPADFQPLWTASCTRQIRRQAKMDSGFYAAVTGLISRTDALDLVANNLANASTTGYKAQHELRMSRTSLEVGRRPDSS